MSVSTIVIHHGDEVQVDVGPVNELLNQVKGQRGGLLRPALHDAAPLRPVQMAALQLGYVSVIGEEQLPEAGERKVSLTLTSLWSIYLHAHVHFPECTAKQMHFQTINLANKKYPQCTVLFLKSIFHNAHKLQGSENFAEVKAKQFFQEGQRYYFICIFFPV